MQLSLIHWGFQSWGQSKIRLGLVVVFNKGFSWKNLYFRFTCEGFIQSNIIQELTNIGKEKLRTLSDHLWIWTATLISYYTQSGSYRIFQSSWAGICVCASKSLFNPLYETRGHGSAHLGDLELVMVLHSILQTGFKWQYEVNRDTTPKSEKEQNREERKKKQIK